MKWYDFFKVFNYSFADDPLSRKKDKRNLPGAGVTQPDAMPDLRNADGLTAGSGAFIRVQNDLIDVQTTSSRMNRMKEYQRLAEGVAEIDRAMTVFADEACVAGRTNIATVFDGMKSIEWLVKHKAGERFPVYCYDFEKGDYTIGWAFDPRYVKTAETIKLILDDGTYEIVTPDHRVLRRDGTWVQAGQLHEGDDLMPFYRIRPANRFKVRQFPRIYTHNKGWVHERQFIDEWRTGKDLPEYERVNKACRMVGSGLPVRKIAKLMNHDWHTVENCYHREGFSFKEIRSLARRSDRRRVIGIHRNESMPVYDLSVEKYENFCTDSMVMHNCQKDDKSRVFKVECENKEVVSELNHLYFHREMLNYNQRTVWDKFRRLCIKGDAFWEIVIDPDDPKNGIVGLQDLQPETMFRIESTRGKLVEFQQSREGPDYKAIENSPIELATDSELAQANAIRFTPKQVVHIRLGDYRKNFYPYGVSLIEPARGPAHQLRMMEDAMVVYRLTRAPERRVFYIDVGQLPPFKAEAFMERLKDQFRKKKVVRNNNTQSGASAVEERWHPPAQDEDYWLPLRPNSNTRIETLPGAQNLGEIDDTVYFRNKLFTALNFPPNYFANEDPNSTRITLSAQNVQFAMLIERLQSYFEEALWEIADRHLTLRGFPPETYEDLAIKMTPPSAWREMSQAELTTNRINNANSMKGSQLMSDFDILTKWMKYTEDEAKEMISRNKIQKLEDLKLQVLAQNPQLLGVGIPGQGEQEIGAEPGGPNPMLGGGAGGQPPAGMPGMPPGAPGAGGGPPVFQKDEPTLGGEEEAPSMMPPEGQGQPIPDPSEEEVQKYDLEIQDYEAEQDEEDIDYSEIDR